MNRVLTCTAFLATALVPALGAQATPGPLARERAIAASVTITRDDWGIAHVHGRTDADAVFGMIYAQAEDDFNRIEVNYLTSLGRMAEAEGGSAVWEDLRTRLYTDPAELRVEYRKSPLWLRRLMDAWADGLNYFLATHPDVHPRVLTHFEPWMALSFSEGSIGGDIERIDLRQLAAFYGHEPEAARDVPPTPLADLGSPPEPTGSNGIAIGPALTADHHAMLLINPHTSFFFRSELQMTSDEGLDAYGAATWGQFFLYQGFNRHVGWMHTSSGVDAVDEYRERVVRRGNGWGYRYGDQVLPISAKRITLKVKTATGLEPRTFTALYTRHGPVIRREDSTWVTFRMMYDPRHALMQSFGRTKATDLASFQEWMRLHANSSNNTIYADDQGHIAYWHANFIPRRDTSFDWTRPVDGSDPRTDWGPLLTLEQSPRLLDPSTGWLYNSNNWPWSAAGPASQRRADFPRYVEMGSRETPRGYHALRILPAQRGMTLDSLVAVAFDSYLPAFDSLLPPLIRAYDALPRGHPFRSMLGVQVDSLSGWDRRWSATSIPTTLAVFWATEAARKSARAAIDADLFPDDYVATRAKPELLLEALSAALDSLRLQFGSWRTPWGEVNRFQRLTDDIDHPFADSGASIPVPFTSARWGSLASFGARPYPGTKRWYGTSGNSFVAVVEFGDSVRARAVTAGGESGDPRSPHFNDEATRYASGDLRTVYFYPSQLRAHTERTYRPGR